MKRLRIKLQAHPAIEITRASLRREKLVYIIVASDKLRYRWGSSLIAYIGSTQNGVRRMAGSAADLTGKLLKERGVRSLGVRVVTCPPRRKVQTWRRLEDALLLAFRQGYGELPRFNKQVPRGDPFKLFAVDHIKRILEGVGAPKEEKRRRRRRRA